MIQISQHVSIPDNEIEFTAVRASGPGGQHVNKVSTAITLRFNIPASSLPDVYKSRLLRLKDRRITKEGVLVIKSQVSKSQYMNKEDAVERLVVLIKRAVTTQKRRKPTRPSVSSKRKRLSAKKQRGEQKKLRQKRDFFD